MVWRRSVYAQSDMSHLYFLMKRFFVTLIYLLVILGIVGILITIWKYYSSDFISSGPVNPTIIGTFGDFIGGFFGTIFTIATMLLVWLTYSDQKHEIQKRNYDSVFFSLLGMLNEHIHHMDLNIAATSHRPAHQVHGRDCFKHFCTTCQFHLSSGNTIEQAIQTTYTNNESDLGPYLKYLKNIIRQIRDFENNTFYIDTLNSTITGYELALINYFMFSNLLSDDDKTTICRFKTLLDLDLAKINNQNIYICR